MTIIKFNHGDTVEHVKTQGRYQITGTPVVYRLESTGEPAYAYRCLEKGIVWVRSQTEMETPGKFVKIGQDL